MLRGFVPEDDRPGILKPQLGTNPFFHPELVAERECNSHHQIPTSSIKNNMYTQTLWENSRQYKGAESTPSKQLASLFALELPSLTHAVGPMQDGINLESGGTDIT